MTRRLILAVFVCLFAGCFAAYGQEKSAGTASDGPDVGQQAPDFALPWATAEAWYFNPNDRMKLSAQKGSVVILAFYPADWSPG